MRVNIDAKVLVNSGDLISEYTKELENKEFAIVPNQWGDLTVVKFADIKVELKYVDKILDKRKAKSRGEVLIRTQMKKKFIANDIIISNKNFYFVGDKVKTIEINKILQIEMYDNYFDIVTQKERFGIMSNSLKFNIHVITMLEWISSGNIDEKYSGKKIKFTRSNQ